MLKRTTDPAWQILALGDKISVLCGTVSGNDFWQSYEPVVSDLRISLLEPTEKPAV